MTSLFVKSTHRIALIAAVLLSTTLSVSVAQDVELDKIRAVVNEGVVLDSDLEAAIRFFKQQARAAH